MPSRDFHSPRSYRGGALGLLLDHLIGGGQQRFRDGKAERLGGFEVDHQLDFCGLLDWPLGWFLAFENPPGIDANFVVRIAEVAASRVGSRRGPDFE
jgi:hypothetical protein